jgi:hypothetical protein
MHKAGGAILFQCGCAKDAFIARIREQCPGSLTDLAALTDTIGRNTVVISPDGVTFEYFEVPVRLIESYNP